MFCVPSFLIHWPEGGGVGVEVVIFGCLRSWSVDHRGGEGTHVLHTFVLRPLTKGEGVGGRSWGKNGGIDVLHTFVLGSLPREGGVGGGGGGEGGVFLFLYVFVPCPLARQGGGFSWAVFSKKQFGRRARVSPWRSTCVNEIVLACFLMKCCIRPRLKS